MIKTNKTGSTTLENLLILKPVFHFFQTFNVLTIKNSSTCNANLHTMKGYVLNSNQQEHYNFLFQHQYFLRCGKFRCILS